MNLSRLVSRFTPGRAALLGLALALALAIALLALIQRIHA